MKIKFAGIAVALAGLLATPAFALSDAQMHKEIEGMYCAGSYCTSKATVSKTENLPDIVTTKATGGVSSFKTIKLPENGTYRLKYKWAADGEWNLHESNGITRKTVRKPGGTVTVQECVTTTKHLIHNGVNTSRDLVWTINTSQDKVAGSC